MFSRLFSILLLTVSGWGLAATETFGSSQASGCGDRVSDLLDRFTDYQKASRNSKTGKRSYLASRRSLLDALELYSSDRCFPEILDHYVGWVLGLTNTFVVDSFVGGGAIPSLILQKLSEHRLLRPLTPEIRKELGGVWDEFMIRDGERVPTIMAAYDCRTTTIWYDPFIPPFDLSGVLLHELNHLVRDKLAFGEFWDRAEKKLNSQELLILDEVMANLMGAFSQFRLFTDWRRGSGDRRSFEIPGGKDLNLFSRKGNLARIWFPLANAKSHHDFDGFESFYAPIAEGRFNPELSAITRIVGRRYFPELAYSPDRIVQSLQAWLAEKDARACIDPLAATMSRPFSVGPAGSDSIAFYQELRPWITPDSTGIPPISPGCSALSSAVDLQHGKEGVRPGKEGVRPGKEGVRPGKEGVRPSKNIRPCLWPEKGL